MTNGSGLRSQTAVTAILGPTNTGKTYSAMQKVKDHASSICGFPLRLLARENYDRLCADLGADQVALITGEERIIPPTARHFVCTVESMPLDRPVDIVVVDEIQLCAHHDRGHVFTDRLLHARGRKETVFLGADSMREVIKALLPDTRFESRPRFSTLKHTGDKGLGRLPRRSAVVAFSMQQLYAIAERLRHKHGGAALVLGALSPRTRNAQVGLYQSGDVDYLVATDAIGMGLNMDVSHVAFASRKKFDGRDLRTLRVDEVAQIAGRAGRYTDNGSFGTTLDAGPFSPSVIEAVERHQLFDITKLRWRNAQLDYSSVGALLKSLTLPPDRRELQRTGHGPDQAALFALSQNPAVQKRAQGYDNVALLWRVCGVPDFRRNTPEVHHKLLTEIYLKLTESSGVLPEAWVENQVMRYDRTDGDPDALMARIAHIRTWTFLSHRHSWMPRAMDWQEQTRAIEDRLSDALHEQLTSRFVDSTTSVLVKDAAHTWTGTLGEQLMAQARAADGAASGKPGKPGKPGKAGQKPASKSAAAKIRGLEALQALLGEAPASTDDMVRGGVLSLTDEGQIAWQPALPADPAAAPDADSTTDLADPAQAKPPKPPKADPAVPPRVVATLTRGKSLFAPTIRVEAKLEPADKRVFAERLQLFVDDGLVTHLGQLLDLRDDPPLSGVARGLAYQLSEHLGVMPRAALTASIKELDKESRRTLHALGVRLGFSRVYIERLMRPEAQRWRAVLWWVHGDHVGAPPLSEPGRVRMTAQKAPHGYLDMLGWVRAGDFAYRIDILERLVGLLVGRMKKARTFALDAEIMNLLGASKDEAAAVLRTVGYVPAGRGEDDLWRRKAPPGAKPGGRGRPGRRSGKPGERRKPGGTAPGGRKRGGQGKPSGKPGGSAPTDTAADADAENAADKPRKKRRRPRKKRPAGAPDTPHTEAPGETRAAGDTGNTADAGSPGAPDKPRKKRRRRPRKKRPAAQAAPEAPSETQA